MTRKNVGSSGLAPAWFGGSLTALTLLTESRKHPGAAPPWPAIAALTEIGFPIGCALLNYVGQVVTQSYRQVEKGSMRVAG